MRILLIGAGFTRNWGGWLASEFVGELCGRLDDRPHLNEMLRVYSNFENVFGERLVVANSEPENCQAREDVTRMQAAIQDTFREMNRALANRDLNFSTEARCSIRRFLSRFDAIFTLNQDLFFELHYDSMELESEGKWNGYSFPGITITHNWRTATHIADRINMELTVAPAISAVRNRIQPIYKLHGSSNWQTSDGNHVIVVGTGKEDAIARNELLAQYQRIFREHVCSIGAKIMVIGYSFSDSHINSALLEGARLHSLSMYLVDPAGLKSFDSHKQVSANGRNELLEIPLIGISQRQLVETFANSDNAAFRSIERFLGITPRITTRV